MKPNEEAGSLVAAEDMVSEQPPLGFVKHLHMGGDILLKVQPTICAGSENSRSRQAARPAARVRMCPANPGSDPRGALRPDRYVPPKISCASTLRT